MGHCVQKGLGGFVHNLKNQCLETRAAATCFSVPPSTPQVIAFECPTLHTNVSSSNNRFRQTATFCCTPAISFRLDFSSHREPHPPFIILLGSKASLPFSYHSCVLSFASRVSCLVSHVSCLMSHVSCLVSRVLLRLSLSNVSCFMYRT